MERVVQLAVSAWVQRDEDQLALRRSAIQPATVSDYVELPSSAVVGFDAGWDLGTEYCKRWHLIRSVPFRRGEVVVY